jgi:hypothetical protein
MPTLISHRWSERQVQAERFFDQFHEWQRDDADAFANPLHSDRTNLFSLCFRVVREAGCRGGSSAWNG